MAVRYPARTSFRDAVEAEVAAYFEREGISRHGSYAMWAKTAILALWLIGSYLALVFVAATAWQAALLATSLGCAMAGIGFNVQHDGGHRAYSSSPAVNRLMGFSLDVLGGSSYFWHYKHAIAHHTYPNISGSDDDIFVGPLGRFSPHDRRYWFHRFQHLYVWALYAFLAVKWQLLDDFRSIVKPGIADTKVPRPPRGEHALFWLGKGVFFALAVGVPLLLHPVVNVIAIFLLTGAVLGVVLSVVFQLAHCLGEADFGKPSSPDRLMDRDWATYQVESTVDFGRTNRLLTWFVGGLNFQIEHHLFPRICHTHYPALSPIVEAVCQRHGVRYVAHGTAWSALRSHYLWLRQLGRASTRPAATSASVPAAQSSMS
jgi:linoleoyl-CoA desaturase